MDWAGWLSDVSVNWVGESPDVFMDWDGQLSDVFMDWVGGSSDVSVDWAAESSDVFIDWAGGSSDVSVDWAGGLLDNGIESMLEDCICSSVRHDTEVNRHAVGTTLYKALQKFSTDNPGVTIFCWRTSDFESSLKPFLWLGLVKSILTTSAGSNCTRVRKTII